MIIYRQSKTELIRFREEEISMADQGDDSFPAPDSPLQEAFDQEAGDLDLRVEPQTLGPGDLADFACAETEFARAVDLPVAPAPPPVDATDDTAIRTLVEGYESLDPTILASRWRDFAVDPYVGVGPSWLALVDQPAIEGWLATPALADALAAYPPFSPRRQQLHDFRIAYLGDTRAVATYQVEEEYRNGKTSLGNRACIVFRLDTVGWRIAVATQGGVADTAGTR